jgi:hypothetical protein
MELQASNDIERLAGQLSYTVWKLSQVAKELEDLKQVIYDGQTGIKEKQIGQ